ncbi:MAG TPA: peptidylprolyl isomerase [Candidatus Limnocylindrales bacterium]
MTFRTRTTAKPTRRRAHHDDTRRALFINISFGLAILAAFSVLGSIAFAGYYGGHFVAIGSVNGQSINKDDVSARVAVNLARFEREIDDYGQLRNQGKITSAEYNTVVGGIKQNETQSTMYSDALNQLTQEAMLAQYANKHGISVTDKQVDDQIVADGTLDEQRHVMVIGVAPTPTPPADVPTPAELQAAQTQAQQYHDDIASGKATWDAEAKASNAGSVGATGTTGDLFLNTKKALKLDPALVDAVFNLKAVNDLTAVIKCSDGLYRFATVTEITPPYVDADWHTVIDQNASDGAYRGAARAEALQIAIKNSIDAQYVTGPSDQRHVLEIGVSAGYGAAGAGDEVKIKMMLFAPDHGTVDPSTLDPANDPAWKDAKTRADAAVAALKKDVTQFATLEKDTTNNDDQQWTTSNGELPWLPQSIFAGDATQQQGLGMTATGTAVFAAGLTPNTVVGPVQETTLGYVVAVFEARRAEPAQRISDAMLRIASGTPFATEVATSSEAIDAVDGGDLGWVTHYSLTQDLEDAIFQTPVGGVSRTVLSSGYYWIFKVVDAQKDRTPTAAEAAVLLPKVFNTWLTDLTNHTNIWTDQTGLTSMYPAASAS